MFGREEEDKDLDEKEVKKERSVMRSILFRPHCKLAEATR